MKPHYTYAPIWFESCRAAKIQTSKSWIVQYGSEAKLVKGGAVGELYFAPMVIGKWALCFPEPYKRTIFSILGATRELALIQLIVKHCLLDRVVLSICPPNCICIWKVCHNLVYMHI